MSMNAEKRAEIVRSLADGCRQFLVANPAATKDEVREAMLGVMRRESAAAGDAPEIVAQIQGAALEMYDDVWKLANEVSNLN